MHTLIFDRHNISLEYENNCVIIRQPDIGPRSIPLRHVRKVMCVHSVLLSTSLLGQLWQRGIDFICLNNRYSERSFALIPNQQKQVSRRCLQYAWQQHEHLCMPLAQRLCQHRLLVTERLPEVRNYPLMVYSLQQARQAMAYSKSLNELRGMEGAIQRQLFEHWRDLLPKELGFVKRVRRPPTDPVNGLLSLTYTIAMQEAIRQCTAAGLDSQLGVYHRVFQGRHSLACDLMEPLRPVCEQWVVQCFKTGLLDRRNFSGFGTQGSPCLLGKRGREIYYQAIDSQLRQWQRQLRAAALWLSRQLDRGVAGDEQQENLAPDSV